MWQPGKETYYTPVMSDRFPMSLSAPRSVFALADVQLHPGLPATWPGDAVTPLAKRRPVLIQRVRTGFIPELHGTVRV